MASPSRPSNQPWAEFRADKEHWIADLADRQKRGEIPTPVDCTCPRCGATDWVRIFPGEPVPAPMLCERCRREWQNFQEDTPARYRTAKVEDLAPGLLAVFRSLTADRGLYLWGLPGVGKTHAMHAFRRSYWEERQQSRRVVWDELCMEIRNTFKPRSDISEWGILRQTVNVRVLMLDDVGVCTRIGRKETEFAMKTFLHIIDGRLEACRPTFITSNKSIENLGASFGERIASRLLQAVEVVKLVGPDRRLSRGGNG